MIKHGIVKKKISVKKDLSTRVDPETAHGIVNSWSNHGNEKSSKIILIITKHHERTSNNSISHFSLGVKVTGKTVLPNWSLPFAAAS